MINKKILKQVISLDLDEKLVGKSEFLVHSGRVRIPYEWTAGETASRFLIELRDNLKILGTRCPACRRVYVPPKRNCGDCFETASEWVEVGTAGRLITYTILSDFDRVGRVDEHPAACGLVQLDGADTALLHLLGEFQPGQVRTGMRVEAVFRNERTASLLDIAYFRPQVSK